MDSVVDWGPVDVRWSGLARALGLGPLGGLVVNVLGRKGTVKENIQIDRKRKETGCESYAQEKSMLNHRMQ